MYVAGNCGRAGDVVRNTMIEAATLLEVVLDEAKFAFIRKRRWEGLQVVVPLTRGAPPTKFFGHFMFPATAGTGVFEFLTSIGSNPTSSRSSVTCSLFSRRFAP